MINNSLKTLLRRSSTRTYSLAATIAIGASVGGIVGCQPVERQPTWIGDASSEINTPLQPEATPPGNGRPQKQNSGRSTERSTEPPTGQTSRGTEQSIAKRFENSQTDTRPGVNTAAGENAGGRGEGTKANNGATSARPNKVPSPGDTPLATGTDRSEWESGVERIITRPTLVAPPATQRSSPGSGNTAGTTARPTEVRATAAPDVPTPTLTFDDIKKVDTSLATAPLVRLLAMKLNGIPYTEFAGYGAIDFVPNLHEGTNPDAITNEVLSREPTGSRSAIKRLINGECDLAFTTRYPTDADFAAARKNGIALRGNQIATEALVFMVNANNPLKTVSRQSLTTIFTGGAKTWGELKLVEGTNSDFAKAPITLAYRARGLGTQELIEQMLLKDEPLGELPVSPALSSTKLVLDATAEDNQTLGFSVFVYAANMQKNAKIRLLSVDGVQPEPARIASRDYPLTTPIYVLSRADLGKSSHLENLRQWLLSKQGQQTLAEAGYMPIVSQAWTEQRLMSGGDK